MAQCGQLCDASEQGPALLEPSPQSRPIFPPARAEPRLVLRAAYQAAPGLADDIIRASASHARDLVRAQPELHATTPLQHCRATTGARAEGALASARRKWKAWLLCSGRHAAVLVPMEQEPRRDTLLCCLCQCLLLGLFGIISSGHGPLQWTPFEALCGLSLSGPARRGPHWGERGERKLARELRRSPACDARRRPCCLARIGRGDGVCARACAGPSCAQSPQSVSAHRHVRGPGRVTPQPRHAGLSLALAGGAQAAPCRQADRLGPGP